MFAGRPALWVFVVLAVARGTGDAVFTPALSGLTVELAPRDDLVNANALLSAARSAAAVAGPGLAGVLVALAGPGTVIALDAASYAVSVLALASLRLPPARARAARSYLEDLRDGWAEFRGRPWLVITTVQFTLFNLLTWGPYLLLGPVLSRDYLGGAGAWGAIMACYGGGSGLGAVAALGRNPRHPMIAATVATFGYGVPCALLALHAPVAAVAAGALVAGAGSALGGTFAAAAEQQQLPPEVLARVSAFQIVTAFAFGPLAFAAAGPVAAVVGARALLGFGAAWSALSSAVVLALPAVRAVTAPAPGSGHAATDVDSPDANAVREAPSDQTSSARVAVPRSAVRGDSVPRSRCGAGRSCPCAVGSRRPGRARAGLADGGLAGPERRRLHPVLAGRGAEPAGAVA